MNYAKELTQEELKSIFDSASIIWEKFPELKKGCFSLIERPHHIWDWCEEKDLEPSDFCALLASKFLINFSDKFLIEVYCTKDAFKIKSNYSSSVGCGKNLMFAISDLIINTKVDFSSNYSIKVESIRSFILNLKKHKTKH